MNDYADSFQHFLEGFDQAIQESNPLKLLNYSIKSEFLQLLSLESLMKFYHLEQEAYYMDIEVKIEALKQIGAKALVDRTLNKIIQSELYQLMQVQGNLRRELAQFERRYRISSEECWNRFEAGELGDDADYFEWTGLYEIYQANEVTLQRLKVHLK